MLYDGDGVYCKYCSTEGARICHICEAALRGIPEKLYIRIRSMAPKELLRLDKYIEGDKKSQDPKKTFRQRWHW